MGSRSLLLRLLAVSAVVSLLSIAATAWLAVLTTTRAIQREQGQALADDARIYDALVGHAATHRDWSQAGPLVRSLARSTGHRIVLTDRARTPIADSASGALPDRASATVDPLRIDTVFASPTAEDRIDPRVIGPFQLTTAERADLRAAADRAANCLRDPPSLIEAGRAPMGVPDVRIVDGPSGRPHLEALVSDLLTDIACARPRAVLAVPTGNERRALAQLDTLAGQCLARKHLPPVKVELGYAWGWTRPVAGRGGPDRNAAAAGCVADARREQLTPYVAPPALLFVSTPGAAVPGSFDLSPANRVRIAAVTALVLLVAVGVTTLVAVRLVRPLRALTVAADRVRDGAAATVAVTGPEEIARLATAFNDMAERRRQVEQLRRAMVGDVAHEMRTPVTNIRGWLEAAEDGVVPLDRELMSSLLEEALLLQHVIDDLQDLSAADAGELRLHPQPVDVADLLATVADAFAATADRAGITLLVDTQPMTCSADPIRLRQAVGNLLTNALRHTPAGGRITISARTRGEAQVIDVADTGPGLTPEEQAMVFERFWRAERSRSRQTGGSGLGLSIVRKLAEAHGGTVSVTSTPGAGATFTLRLPREPGQASDPARP